MKTNVKVPETLEECFVTLKEMCSLEELRYFINATDEERAWHHMGVGMWMRNNWGLWQGGPLQEHFKAMGIWHADDMSGIILESFLRHLKNQPLKLDEQVQSYKDFWAKQEK